MSFFGVHVLHHNDAVCVGESELISWIEVKEDSECCNENSNSECTHNHSDCTQEVLMLHDEYLQPNSQSFETELIQIDIFYTEVYNSQTKGYRFLVECVNNSPPIKCPNFKQISTSSFKC